VYYRAENTGGDPTSFGPWTSLGGVAKFLAVASQAAGQNGGVPAVFVVGSDNQVYANVTLTFNAWNAIGLNATQLAAALDGNNRVEVFAITNTGDVQANIQLAGGGFTAANWTDLGGVAKQIVVGQNGAKDQTLQAFVIGSDNAVYTNKQTSLQAPSTF